MKNILQITAVIAIFGFGFIAGWMLKPKCAGIVSERIDTLILRDTLRDTVLIPVDRYIVRLDTVTVKVAGDTLYVEVEVPIERKEYRTDDYRATIEGFRPELIAMEIYRQTHYITEMKTIEVPNRNRWGIGLNVSYGAYVRDGQIKMAPFIGAGVQYNLIRW
jgi:hypothetical protein